MSRALVAQALETALTAYDATLVFQSDFNRVQAPPVDKAWHQLAFLDGAQRLESMGGQAGNLERGPILVYLNTYIPLGEGDGLAVEIDNVARDAMRRLIAGDWRWQRFESGGEGKVDGWYRKQTIAVFLRSVRV